MSKGPSKHRAKRSATKAQKRKGVTFTPRETAAHRPLTEAERDLDAAAVAYRSELEEEHTGAAVEAWLATLHRTGSPEVAVIVDGADEWARVLPGTEDAEDVVVVTAPPAVVANALRKCGVSPRVVKAASAPVDPSLVRVVVLAAGDAAIATHGRPG